MGWLTGPCWYCGTDLDELIGAGFSTGGEAFERHMRFNCINEPLTVQELRAGEKMAAELRAAADFDGDLDA